MVNDMISEDTGLIIGDVKRCMELEELLVGLEGSSRALEPASLGLNLACSID